MESPLIGGFVEKQNKIKIPAWRGKTTEGRAKIKYDETDLYTTYHFCVI
jgi:hypothetical protein